MSPRDTLLRVAYLLQQQDIPAQVACIKSRLPLLVIRDSHALRVNESGAIVVQCVRGEGDRVLLRARTCRHETAEDLARLVQVRQGIAEAEEARRRAALTPEQRARGPPHVRRVQAARPAAGAGPLPRLLGGKGGVIPGNRNRTNSARRDSEFAGAWLSWRG